MAIQQQKPAYMSEIKRFNRVFNMKIRLFWALMAFVYVEITGFGDNNFVEKNVIVMRLLLVFTVITFLIIIFTTILQYPHLDLVNYVITLVLACAACVLLVLMISTFTSVIVFIIWIFALSSMAFHQEPTTTTTTYVSDLKSFKNVTDMIFWLFYVLIALVGVEITSLFGVEEHLFFMRFLLVLAVFTFLIVIIPTVLENPSVLLLQTMVLMVTSCAVCVLLVLLISTVTAVIVFIFWSVGIFTVAVQRWDHLVHQIKAIRNVVVANKI